jgi:hypothetical protein
LLITAGEISGDRYQSAQDKLGRLAAFPRSLEGLLR